MLLVAIAPLSAIVGSLELTTPAVTAVGAFVVAAIIAAWLVIWSANGTDDIPSLAVQSGKASDSSFSEADVLRARRNERIGAWRDIARRIAHEIKNPLTPIRTSVETLQRMHAKKHQDFDEVFAESTTMIIEEVDRLTNIVNEFSRFARMAPPHAEELDLREIVEHVVALHSTTDAAPNAATVRAELPLDALMVRADRAQLTQVLVNLVKNSLDALASSRTDGSGDVLVYAARPEGSGEYAAIVEIIDNGPGVPIAMKDLIFDPYFTTKPNGSGLGLAIAYRIVSDHGGTIEIDSATTGGAIFRVRLTRTGPRAEADATMSIA